MIRTWVGERTALRASLATAAQDYRDARAGGDIAVWQQAAEDLADLLKVASAHGVQVGEVLTIATADEPDP